MERNPLIDNRRLVHNIATERLQPHHGVGKLEQPIDSLGAVGVISLLKTGPTGVGVSYHMTEPMGSRWHEIDGPEPIISRPVGA